MALSLAYYLIESYTEVRRTKDSQKLPPTDLKLTPNQQGIPWKEENKKRGKNLVHGTEKPQVPQNRTKIVPYKTFDRFIGPFLYNSTE